MAIKDNNEAYDLSLFEPVQKTEVKKNKPKSKKENNLIKFDTNKITKVQRRKRNPLIIIGVSALTVIVAVASVTIVQSNVLLNELNNQIVEANQKISKQENLAAQYQLKVDSKLSTEVVQEYAENVLGMIQAQNVQKNFISLSDGDYAEVIRDDNNSNVFEIIADAFTGLWS